MTFRVLDGHGKPEAHTDEVSDEIPRYRVDVVTHNVAEAVIFVGGWAYDMAMAGWDVRTLTADDTDDRPLRILGSRAVELATHLSSNGPAEIIAVSCGLLATDSHVRDHVAAAVGRFGTEVIIWGTERPERPKSNDPSQHRLSMAARVFKTEALAATGAPRTPCGNVERFWRYPSSVPQSSTVTSSARARLIGTGSDPCTA